MFVKNILHSYVFIIVVFTRRHANDSAHSLAKAVLFHVSRNIFDIIPNCIATIIINDMS
jgi:hypothetical protein